MLDALEFHGWNCEQLEIRYKSKENQEYLQDEYSLIPS